MRTNEDGYGREAMTHRERRESGATARSTVSSRDGGRVPARPAQEKIIGTGGRHPLGTTASPRPTTLVDVRRATTGARAAPWP